jgi:hypothetical protein
MTFLSPVREQLFIYIMQKRLPFHRKRYAVGLLYLLITSLDCLFTLAIHGMNSVYLSALNCTNCMRKEESRTRHRGEGPSKKEARELRRLENEYDENQDRLAAALKLLEEELAARKVPSLKIHLRHKSISVRLE